MYRLPRAESRGHPPCSLDIIRADVFQFFTSIEYVLYGNKVTGETRLACSSAPLAAPAQESAAPTGKRLGNLVYDRIGDTASFVAITLTMPAARRASRALRLTSLGACYKLLSSPGMWLIARMHLKSYHHRSAPENVLCPTVLRGLAGKSVVSGGSELTDSPSAKSQSPAPVLLG